MVTSQQQVVLIDFGIARFFKEGQRQDTAFFGTPGYAAPEQHGLSQTTARSDLYSLGVTLHHCLTGKDPSSAQPRFAFASIRQSNAAVPPELAILIQRMTALHPSQRPQSASEVLQELTKILQQPSVKTEATAASVGAIRPGLTMQAGGQAPIQAGPSFLLPTVAVGQVLPSALPVPPSPLRQAPPSPIWERGFALLFGLLLLLLAGGSTLAFNFVVASDHWVEAVLILFLVPLNCLSCLIVRRLWPRLLLALTALTALLPAGVFLVQALSPKTRGGIFGLLQDTAIDGFASSTFINKALTAGLVLVGIIVILWLLRPFRLADRLTLLAVFGLALACALVQYPLHDDSVSKHILLVITLISLNQGGLLATRMEWLNR
jgi:hypothetical protein